MKHLASILLLAVTVLVGCGEDGGGGNTPPQVDAAVSNAVCGDAVCAASEIGFCTQDCGGGNGSGSGSNTVTCGNSVCDAGETSANCPNDCTGGGSGSAAACPADPLTECLLCIATGQGCPAGHNQASCQACLLGGGGGIPNCNLDMVCDAGEDPTICPDCQ